MQIYGFKENNGSLIIPSVNWPENPSRFPWERSIFTAKWEFPHQLCVCINETNSSVFTCVHVCHSTLNGRLSSLLDFMRAPDPTRHHTTPKEKAEQHFVKKHEDFCTYNKTKWWMCHTVSWSPGGGRRGKHCVPNRTPDTTRPRRSVSAVSLSHTLSLLNSRTNRLMEIENVRMQVVKRSAAFIAEWRLHPWWTLV